MKPEIFNKVDDGFMKQLENVSNGILPFEQLHHKMPWNFFLPGDSYYFIINHGTNSIEAVSKEVQEVTGYPVRGFDLPLLARIVHSDDRQWYQSAGESIIEFFSQLPMDMLLKYKVRYDVRIRKKNGSIARIMYQGILLEHDAQGRFLRSLCIHSDISWLKVQGAPVLSFIGLEGAPSFMDAGSPKFFVKTKDDLTQREQQVLKLLVEGKISKEVGSLLHISKQTVDTHRKNMLRKKQLNSTSQLVGTAIRLGWI